MKTSKPEIICTIIEPDEAGLVDFEKWQQEQKAELEADGMTITEIDGFKFYGYKNPSPPDEKS